MTHRHATKRPDSYHALMNPRNDDQHWQATAINPSRDELLAPRTQIVADREAYLGQGRHDVGRRISDDQVELFISADVAGSLQREFVQHTPEFIALHDVGMSASLRLLTSLAGAAGARVQRLSIRRQGHGVALAVLQFVEMPLADGASLRVYATDINADTVTRTHVARTLLGYSRLGVLLAGDLPPATFASQLHPFHEAMVRGPWPNRELLMVPLGSSSALAAAATQLAGSTGVAVVVTPQATKPRQAWSYIGGAWNRMHAASTHALPTDMAKAVRKPRPLRAEVTTEPMPLQPAPAALPPVAMPTPGGTSWQAYADRCIALKGCVAACVFDLHSLQVLAGRGEAPAAERLAQQGAMLLSQMNDASRALGLGPALPEASISTSTHHLVLRPVPGHPGVAVHLVLQASQSNLTLARMQLERIEAPQ